MWGCGQTCHTLPTVSAKKRKSCPCCGHWSGIFSRVASDLREELGVACGSCGASAFFAVCPGRFVFSQRGLHRIVFVQFMITSISKRRGEERHIERTKRRRASQARIRQEARLCSLMEHFPPDSLWRRNDSPFAPDLSILLWKHFPDLLSEDEKLSIPRQRRCLQSAFLRKQARFFR